MIAAQRDATGGKRDRVTAKVDWLSATAMETASAMAATRKGRLAVRRLLLFSVEQKITTHVVFL